MYASPETIFGEVKVLAAVAVKVVDPLAILLPRDPNVVRLPMAALVFRLLSIPASAAARAF